MSSDTNPTLGAENAPEESLMSHLIELRSRVMKAGGAVRVVFAALMVWPGAGTVYDFLATPMLSALPVGTKMIATSVISPFMVPLKVTGLLAFCIALPVVLYQAWGFVAPGLYQHEKRLAAPVIFSSTALFFAGIAFCHFFVFGNVFKFIQEFAPKSITPAPDVEQYLSFVMTMFLAFGLTFEIPVVVVLLVRFGLVTVQKLTEIRGYVIVGATVIAAIVTPPDVVSQLMLAIPMILLYELGLLVARLVGKSKSAEDASTASEASQS